jgi:hypothetical protein
LQRIQTTPLEEITIIDSFLQEPLLPDLTPIEITGPTNNELGILKTETDVIFDSFRDSKTKLTTKIESAKISTRDLITLKDQYLSNSTSIQGQESLLDEKVNALNKLFEEIKSKELEIKDLIDNLQNYQVSEIEYEAANKKYENYKEAYEAANTTSEYFKKKFGITDETRKIIEAPSFMESRLETLKNDRDKLLDIFNRHKNLYDSNIINITTKTFELKTKKDEYRELSNEANRLGTQINRNATLNRTKLDEIKRRLLQLQDEKSIIESKKRDLNTLQIDFNTKRDLITRTQTQLRLTQQAEQERREQERAEQLRLAQEEELVAAEQLRLAQQAEQEKLKSLSPQQKLAYDNSTLDIQSKLLQSPNMTKLIDLMIKPDTSIFTDATKHSSITDTDLPLLLNITKDKFPFLEYKQLESNPQEWRDNFNEIMRDNNKTFNLDTAQGLLSGIGFILQTYLMYQRYMKNKITDAETISTINDEYKINYDGKEIKSNRFEKFLELLMNEVEEVIGLTQITEYKLPPGTEKTSYLHPEIHQIIDEDNEVINLTDITTGEKRYIKKTESIIKIDYGKYKKVTEEIKDVCVLRNFNCYLFLKGNVFNNNDRVLLETQAKNFRVNHNNASFNKEANKDEIIRIFKKYLDNGNLIILRIKESVSIIKKSYIKKKYNDHLQLLYHALLLSINVDSSKTKLEITDPSTSPGSNSTWLYFLDKDTPAITNKYLSNLHSNDIYYDKYIKYKTKYLELKYNKSLL